MTRKLLLCVALILIAVSLVLAARAVDLTGGRMRAVPTPGGRAPTIDGSLNDWDLSGAEPVWITAQTAGSLHANVALMYDDDALYVGARISLPGRPLHNPNNPVDAFWGGDLLELRLASDPALPMPLDPASADVKASRRVCHLSFWKNSQTGADFLHIAYGAGFDKGGAVNPAGSQIVVKPGANGYVVEARVPWSALNVPGGRNPFNPGQEMTAVWGVHWGGENQTSALYRANPGSFAFNQPQTWGRVLFSPTGRVAPRHGTMAQALARSGPAPVGVPIRVFVPGGGLKVSVNIFGPRGEVVRELMGGEPHPPGRLAVLWDGRDQWGAPMPPGAYRWGAYFSPGLQAEYVGAVGKSGDPAYETADGRGAWGGDHGNCIAVAADGTGLYFLWVAAEDGRAVVKTDYAGKVLWRKTPFVGGGFGPHYAVAADGRNVYLTLGDSSPQLVKLDAATGQLLPFRAGATTAPISGSAAVPVDPTSSPVDTQPESVGLAVRGREVFASVYSQNVIRAFDPDTGLPLRDLACPGPRGLALDAAGNLYAASFAAGRGGRVLKFAGALGAGLPVVSQGLAAPWGVAVDAGGRLHVSDLGASQQVKTFSPDGTLLQTLGRAGGRTWAGAYDPASFLEPAGLASDAQGGILLAEASLPKVMSRFDAASGRLLGRWFGNPAYAAMTWPDPGDPRTAYFSMEGPAGVARATIPPGGGTGVPTASWNLPRAGYSGVGTLNDYNGAPYVLTAANGRKYFVADANPHGVCLVEGDRLLPVGHIRVVNSYEKGNTTGKNTLEIWTDADGDHQPQAGETVTVNSAAGRPLPVLNETTGSMWMATNGDLYLVTAADSILRIPAAGFNANGSIRWDAARASYVVPTVLDRKYLKGADDLGGGWRSGILGVRRDAAGDVYLCFNTVARYATPALTQAMHEGLGHTGESNAVKFAKYGPDGRLLWMAGRKATSAARPGEMYHFWTLAGLVGAAGGEYVAGQSEWGQFYFYTHDGFFVDALMNNPGLAPPAGPYTFGSETFGGRVQDFPRLGQVWAYQSGFAYRVLGFQNGKVKGERRASGRVTLDRVYAVGAAASVTTGPLQIVPLTDPLSHPDAWADAPVSAVRRSGADLATAQVGYDAGYLYARVHIADATPLQNVADTAALAFKGGDAVGLDLGPAPPHERPMLGDVRLLAARIGGKDRLIAMKPLTAQAEKPEDYFTPAGGHARFGFVGDVPGGKVSLVRDANGRGYTATFAVPRAFLEVPVTPGGSLAADVEVRLSGQGALGIQTLGHAYLFAPANPQTTMTDDIPTEARLYPQFWGSATIK